MLVSALVTAAITAMLRRAGKVDRHGVPSGGWLLGCFFISWFAAAPVFVRAKTLGAQGGDSVGRPHAKARAHALGPI